MKRILFFALLLISQLSFAQVDPPGTPVFKFNKAINNRPKNRQLWVSGHNLSPWGPLVTFPTLQGGTNRLQHKILGDASLISFAFANSVNGSGGFEGVSSGAQLINSVALEWPVNTVSVLEKTSVGGSAQFQVDFDGMGVETDPIGTYIPGGSTINYKVFNRVAFPPTSPAATISSTTGTLTIGTPYYYFITTIDKFRNIESTSTASVTATPTSGNQSIILSWVRNQYALSYNIYRSTTNNASTAQLLANVRMTATSYTDDGSVTPMSTNTPPNQNSFLVANRILRNGESTNWPAGGDGSDRTLQPGALSVPGTDNGTTYGYGAAIVLTDDYSKPSILCLGTSIPNGGGINASTGVLNRAVSNWFDQAITSVGNVNSLNLSVSTSNLQDLTGQTSKNAKYRLAWTRYVNYVWVPQGVNDMPTRTWQQIATDANNLAKKISDNGSRYILNTIAPYVVTTDNCLTIGNQTPSANEAVRLNYNAWARNGCQFIGSTPVLTGGTPSPYIWKVFDECASVEVNASNVLTLNGGYYRVPTSALVSSITLTGTQTLTGLSATGVTWTNSQYNGYVVKVITGAAAGQSALIQGTGASSLVLYANGTTTPGVTTNKGLTTIPSAGDQIEIWAVYANDGLHPNQAGSALIATDAAAFINANVKQYAQ